MSLKMLKNNSYTKRNISIQLEGWWLTQPGESFNFQIYCKLNNVRVCLCSWMQKSLNQNCGILFELLLETNYLRLRKAIQNEWQLWRKQTGQKNQLIQGSWDTCKCKLTLQLQQTLAILRDPIFSYLKYVVLQWIIPSSFLILVGLWLINSSWTRYNKYKKC